MHALPLLKDGKALVKIDVLTFYDCCEYCIKIYFTCMFGRTSERNQGKSPCVSSLFPSPCEGRWAWPGTFSAVCSTAQATVLYQVDLLGLLPGVVVAWAVMKLHKPQMNGLSGSQRHPQLCLCGCLVGNLFWGLYSGSGVLLGVACSRCWGLQKTNVIRNKIAV